MSHNPQPINDAALFDMYDPLFETASEITEIVSNAAEETAQTTMTVIKEFSNELISRLEELDEKYIDNTGENENDNPSSASSVVQDESESNIESNGDEEKRRTSDDEDRMLNYILFC